MLFRQLRADAVVPSLWLHMDRFFVVCATDPTQQHADRVQKYRPVRLLQFDGNICDCVVHIFVKGECIFCDFAS